MSVLVWRKAREKQKELAMDPSASHLHAGYCAAAILLALHSFTDFSLHLPANFALLSVMLGFVLGPIARVRA
jgi:hypothetical protein